MSPRFKPSESLAAYGDNTWLARAMDKIAREIARTQFRLEKTNAKGEIEIIQKHQAIDTLNRPHPISRPTTRRHPRRVRRDRIEIFAAEDPFGLSQRPRRAVSRE